MFTTIPDDPLNIKQDKQSEQLANGLTLHRHLLNGIVAMEFTTLPDGRMHGQYRTFYDNGQIEEETWYENGKEHGTTR